jgi:CRP-like cAMP-binding protein
MNGTMSATTYQDIASYLPRKPIQEFARKHTIYGPGQPSKNLYRVLSGSVVISNSFDGASPMVTQIVGPSGLFGEGLLIGSVDESESAVVLDQARLMSWSCTEMEQVILRDPRLGMALLAYFVKRCAQLNARLEALAFRKTPERVMLALLQLAETIGKPNNGGMRLAALTHQAIAEYVGTSREIVTSQMSELRRAGMLQYSRKFIDVNVGMMREALEQRGIALYPVTPSAAACA